MIEVRNITKYHGRERVLHDVSLKVEQGTQLALIGPGGAGKSLLVKIICGLVKPDGGEVWVNGERIDGMDEVELNRVRMQIGMLFQNYALFDFMTVEENIGFPLRQAGETDEKLIRQRVNDLLHSVDLPGINHQFPNELSGGMKKRVTFARAVINKAPILFYDDPTAGLDPVTSSKIFIMLEKMKQESGTTSIVISHDILGMREICEQWGMLVKGELVFIGSRDEIENCPKKIVQQFWRGESDG